MSTGTHDPLECAALYLGDGQEHALFIATDLIFVSKELASKARRQISDATGIPEHAIMVTATHTHSGPLTVNYLSNSRDPVVPKADADYLNWLLDQIVKTGCAAVRAAVPAEVGLAVARAEGVGTHRHDVAGPADSAVPVVVARSLTDEVPLGCMIVYAMHPTVLHEDSTLISGDFPHFAREYLHAHVLPADCPIVYHNGASGNQSPRHVTSGNTFSEAQRLGVKLGAAIAGLFPQLEFRRHLPLASARRWLELTLRKLPPETEAERAVQLVRAKFERLRAEGASRQEVRTAECDWFGAEETLALTHAAANGQLDVAARALLPAEIQVIQVGTWAFIGWPGEFFVEYALEVRAEFPQAYVITMANGELQGYIVTAEAVTAGVYEATNAVFDASNGPRVVAVTLDLLRGMPLRSA